jgi:putative two-component system response regulator
MLEALRPIAGCRPESFTRPADALACAAAHTDEPRPAMVPGKP